MEYGKFNVPGLAIQLLGKYICCFLLYRPAYAFTAKFFQGHLGTTPKCSWSNGFYKLFAHDPDLYYTILWARFWNFWLNFPNRANFYSCCHLVIPAYIFNDLAQKISLWAD